MLQHIAAAGQGLLAGLEHELDSSFQFAFMLLQHLRGCQQHSRMHIMTTAVSRVWILGRESQSALLRHSQYVHIRAEKQ